MASNFYMSELTTEDKTKFLSIAGGLLSQDGQNSHFRKAQIEAKEAKSALREKTRKFEEEKDELEGSNAYLKRELGLAQDLIRTLTAEVERVTTLYEETTTKNANEMERMQLERTNENLLAAEKIATLEAKLATLEQYEQLKLEFEQTIVDLKEDLRQQTQDSAEKAQLLEEKVQDTMENGERRRRKDIKEVRLEMEAKLEHMLDSTTRSTITENSRLTTEMHYLSHRVTQLLEENKKVVKRNKFLQRELENLRDMSKETTKRVRFFQRLYEQMKQAAKVETAARLEEQEAARMRELQAAEEIVEVEPSDGLDSAGTSSILPFLDVGSVHEEPEGEVAAALTELTTMLQQKLNTGKSEVEYCREKNEELYCRSGRELKVSSSAENFGTVPHPPIAPADGAVGSGSQYGKWSSSIPKVSETIPVSTVASVM